MLLRADSITQKELAAHYQNCTLLKDFYLFPFLEVSRNVKILVYFSSAMILNLE
jgi:hypothetical protein